MASFQTPKIRKYRQRPLRILFGAVGGLCMLFSPAPGAAQYGSLGLSFSDGYSPGTVLVAQNTPAAPAPAPITPANPLVPPPIAPSAPLTPIDPYVVPSGSPPFSWPGAWGTAPSSTGSSPQIYSGNMEQFFPETYQAMRRFREATSVDFTYIPAGSKKEGNYFGVSEFDFRMQLGFPSRFIPNSGPGCTGPGFFYIAPGGSLLWWDGPDTGAGKPGFSPNGFGASLDVGMTPQFNETFSLDAWFRFGVFSDFETINSKSLRYQGRVTGMVNLSRQFKLVAGVLYADRARIKLFPTGGVIWIPREDIMLRLTFPNPKLSMRIYNTGRVEWWGYLHGDYGGGSWSINGVKTDYNDIRIGLGVEFETLTKVGGFFEFGGVFNREIYSHGNAWCKPNNMLYLKTGFVF